MTLSRTPYQVCVECGAGYTTAGDLVTAYNLWREPIEPVCTDVSKVWSCPECGHEFRYPPLYWISGELPAHAARIAECLRRNGFDPARAVERHVIKLQEEAGEVAGAYLRSTGQARRTGTTEDLHEEVADVILTAFSLAHHLDMDINAVIDAKLDKIHMRGWRENPSGTTESEVAA